MLCENINKADKKATLFERGIVGGTIVLILMIYAVLLLAQFGLFR